MAKGKVEHSGQDKSPWGGRRLSRIGKCLHRGKASRDTKYPSTTGQCQLVKLLVSKVWQNEEKVDKSSYYYCKLLVLRLFPSISLLYLRFSHMLSTCSSTELTLLSPSSCLVTIKYNISNKTVVFYNFFTCQNYKTINNLYIYFPIF